MLGSLPTTITVNGHEYPIHSDYRNILTIISAFGDEELSNKEKAYVCMVRLFHDLNEIQDGDFEEAYKAAVAFIECNIRNDRPSPKVINWEKDEQLIFPAINKAAGMEVRAVPYMHWWTFLGYFQSIDSESIWGFILSIRQKKAKHKKLEKHEAEFYKANFALCSVDPPKHKKSAEENLSSIFQELLDKQNS